jgi:hypothetical protein
MIDYQRRLIAQLLNDDANTSWAAGYEAGVGKVEGLFRRIEGDGHPCPFCSGGEEGWSHDEGCELASLLKEKPS